MTHGGGRERGARRMRIPRLHVEPPLAAGTRITLPEVASRHVMRTLRLGSGDSLTVFDGRGGEHEAIIAHAARGAVEVEVGAHHAIERESELAVELGQGICRGDRMDLVVQKATELGVRAIRPLLSERTVVRLDPERARRRIARWRAVAVHAAQQSGRTRVPVVSDVEELDTWLARAGTGPGVLLSPQGASSISGFARPAPGEMVRLLAGPEGGLAPGEAARAQAAGFASLRLGPRVLRTETAALVALSVLQACWGDLR